MARADAPMKAAYSEALPIDHGSAPEHLGGGGQHLVGRGDHLGVHLVGALRRDEGGDLRHGVDVGFLEIALLEVAEALRAGIAGQRRPEAAVSTNRLSPIDSRPSLLMKRASWSWPSVCGAVWPVIDGLHLPVGADRDARRRSTAPRWWAGSR